MADKMEFRNEDQLKNYFLKQHGLSPGRFDILKMVSVYLDLGGDMEESQFEEVRDIFYGYISNRVPDIDSSGLYGGSMTGLRSDGIIDKDQHLTAYGFKLLRLVSYHLSRLPKDKTTN